MGGIIIILATLIPVLLFAKLENIYVILLIVTTVWMGTIGFIDDYIKKFKNDKQGLPGKFKIIGQVGLGFLLVQQCISTQISLCSEALPILELKLK